ncbi:MAG: PAS domain S-box-containing protein [Saprospiraceae bacterium]|jgi:PAS domain S-box-containing protein
MMPDQSYYSLLFPVFDEQGGVTGTGGIVADITGLKQAERQRILTQKNFELMFNAAPIGMALVEPISGRILEANQYYLTLLGLQRSELDQATIHDVNHPDEIEVTQENIESLATGESSSYGRLKRYLHRDGSTIWMELHVKVLEKVEPDDAVTCLTIVQEISRKREVESPMGSELEMSSADKEPGVHVSAEEGILTVNSEKIVLTYNRKFIELWDISNKIIAKKSGRLALKDVLSKVKNPASILQMVRQSENQSTQTEIHEIQMKDGRIFELRIAPMLGYEEKFYGWMWSTRDLTQIKREEEQLRRSSKMQA